MAELNICRLLLKSICILDISKGYRKYIIVTAWNIINNTASSRYKWTTQPKPHQKVWETWQAALQSAYRMRRNPTPTLNTQLGPWLHPVSTIWVYSPSQYRILKKQGWTAYRPLLTRQGRSSYQLFTKTEENTILLPPTNSLNTKKQKDSTIE